MGLADFAICANKIKCVRVAVCYIAPVSQETIAFGAKQLNSRKIEMMDVVVS